MRIRNTAMLTVFLISLIGSSRAQSANSYLARVDESLVPFNEVSVHECHNLLIRSNGPWATFAMPDGMESNDSRKYTWTVLQYDLRQVWLDLTQLDEDKVLATELFSLEYLSQHAQGTPYKADITAVLLKAKGMNDRITVNTVDLERVKAVNGRKGLLDKDLGIGLDQRKAVLLIFDDKQHADLFQALMKKAVVACKAEASVEEANREQIRHSLAPPAGRSAALAGSAVR